MAVVTTHARKGDAMTAPLAVSHWMPQPGPFAVDVTIGDALRGAAAQWADRVALLEGTAAGSPRRWTFADLLASSEQVARALLQHFEPGEHVAVWATNRPEWTLTQFGAALAGIVIVTVNPAYGPAEAEFVLRQSRAAGLLVEDTVRGRDLRSAATRLLKTLPDLRDVVAMSGWETFLAAGAKAFDLPPVDAAAPAQIQYTSGTTGHPKGALLAHRGLALNGHLYAQTVGAGPDDVWVNPMPLFHTAGCGLATMGALQTGGAHVLPPGFDADAMLDLVEQHSATVTLVVPTMLIRLLEAQRLRPRDISSWRLITLGGAPVPADLARRAERELGVEVAIGFGQTECSPYISHTRPRDPDPLWIETVGQPLPLIEVKVADPVSGEPRPLGEAGEICTRSPCVMLEYFDDPAATRQAVDRDGWLRTGDIGTMDALGYLRIQGRMKDTIIRGGENIYPREIEDVLYGHEAIVNVSVVGIPDAEWGEVVVAFVQLRPDASTTADEMEAFCRRSLASFKVPRQWIFLEEFPQTASGKIQKYALRERFLGGCPDRQAR
jgi:fatty-acyl-CoA synthase